MKLIDVYNNYKNDYKEYVLIIENGIFYNIFNEDTSIIYSLLNYKIKKGSNNYIIGFPQNNLNKVIDTLKKNNINYLVIDKNNTILDKYKSNNNCYSNFELDFNRLNYINNRIDNIYKLLKDKVFDSDIEKILFEIEKLL